MDTIHAQKQNQNERHGIIFDTQLEVISITIKICAPFFVRFNREDKDTVGL